MAEEGKEDGEKEENYISHQLTLRITDDKTKTQGKKYNEKQWIFLFVNAKQIESKQKLIEQKLIEQTMYL